MVSTLAPRMLAAGPTNSDAFSAEGQVRVITDGDHMLVQMNTSGNSGADSVIELTGNIDVTAIDFTL